NPLPPVRTCPQTTHRSAVPTPPRPARLAASRPQSSPLQHQCARFRHQWQAAPICLPTPTYARRRRVSTARDTLRLQVSARRLASSARFWQAERPTSAALCPAALAKISIHARAIHHAGAATRRFAARARAHRTLPRVLPIPNVRRLGATTAANLRAFARVSRQIAPSMLCTPHTANATSPTAETYESARTIHLVRPRGAPTSRKWFFRLRSFHFCLSPRHTHAFHPDARFFEIHVNELAPFGLQPFAVCQFALERTVHRHAAERAQTVRRLKMKPLVNKHDAVFHQMLK